jgi:hypothetical protein
MIHQFKCPGLGDTVPEIYYSNVKLLENFEKFFWSFKITDGFIVSEMQKFTYLFQPVSCYNGSKSWCGNYSFCGKI